MFAQKMAPIIQKIIEPNKARIIYKNTAPIAPIKLSVSIKSNPETSNAGDDGFFPEANLSRKLPWLSRSFQPL